MQDEIDKWLEEYGEDATFADAARFIRQLRESVTTWQKQAGYNLTYRAEQIATLVRLGLTDQAQRNVELYARRLARQEPLLAETIRPLLPPMNPLRAEDSRG